MKFFEITLVLMIFSNSIFAQDIDYYPPHRKEIKKEYYDRGKYFLENTYKQMKENENVCYADYWNIALAYAYMGQSSDEIVSLLKKSKEDNPENFCFIANYGMKDKSLKDYIFYKILKDDFLDILEGCSSSNGQTPEPLTLKARSHYDGYNYELIQQLNELKLKDQQYRGKDDFLKNEGAIQKQRILDTANERAIEKMIYQYGYPGKTLVGKEWRDIACVILVHANSLEIQEALLPIIAKNANDGELSKGIVRILVDKIQWKKTGKQIFGTQTGIPFEREAKIRAIEKMYGL